MRCQILIACTSSTSSLIRYFQFAQTILIYLRWYRSTSLPVWIVMTTRENMANIYFQQVKATTVSLASNCTTKKDEKAMAKISMSIYQLRANSHKMDSRCVHRSMLIVIFPYLQKWTDNPDQQKGFGQSNRADLFSKFISSFCPMNIQLNRFLDEDHDVHNNPRELRRIALDNGKGCQFVENTVIRPGCLLWPCSTFDVSHLFEFLVPIWYQLENTERDDTQVTEIYLSTTVLLPSRARATQGSSEFRFNFTRNSGIYWGLFVHAQLCLRCAILLYAPE